MKNTDHIYGLLNDLAMDFEDYAKEELSETEKQKLKKAFCRKNPSSLIRGRNSSGSIRRRTPSAAQKIGAIAVALLLAVGILVPTGWGKAVYAATESKLAEISYSVREALGIEKNIAPYANVVNQVVASNGIEMKLTDVIIDKDELILSVLTGLDQPVEWLKFDYDLFINGKKVRNYSAGGISGPLDDSRTRFSTVYAVNIDGIETTGEVDIKVVLKDLTVYPGYAAPEKVKGKWKFEFTASGSELTADSHTLALDYEFEIEGRTYTLEEFRYNPVNQKIYGKVHGPSEHFYEIDLRGQDNLGNEVEFALTRVSGEDLVFKYQNFDRDLSEDISSLTLTPYASKLPENSGKAGDNWQQVGETFTIRLER